MAFRKRPSSGPVLLLLLFIAVSPARAATIDVAAGDVTALRNAITTANGTGEDDTIVLPSGSTFSIAAPNNGVNALPVVTSKLIIQGNDAVIQRTGAGDLRLFDVAGTGDLTLDRLTVKGGQLTLATRDGGAGIRVGGAGKLTLTHATVMQNICNGPQCQGGGIFLVDPQSPLATLVDSTVSLNAADTGGGIALNDNDQTLVLTRSVVSGNSANEGGGIATNGHDTVTLTDSTISGNTASQGTSGGALGGGALDIGGGTWTITGSTFSGNSVSGNATGAQFLYGGAMGENGGATVTMTNCTIVGNTLTNAGPGELSGAGLFGEGGGVWTLRNVTVASNTITGSGGTGGGLATTRGKFNLINSIVANNTAASRPDCYALGSHPVSMVFDSFILSQGHNLLRDPTGCTGFTATTGDLTGQDPLLGSLASNSGPTQTAALLAGSPAIDAGSPAAPGSSDTACDASDQRGVTRPQGSACDIGAYEVGTTTNPGCGVPAATFVSIDCRLDALIAQLQSATDLATLQDMLVKLATQARDRKVTAEGLVATKKKTAKKRLKQAIRKMISFNFRVRSRAARQKIPEATRRALTAQSVPIQQDLQALLKSL